MLPSHLECSLDEQHRYDARTLQGTCSVDGSPLLARYAKPELDRADVARQPWTMWRYRTLLPVDHDEEPVSLGEGATPLVHAARLERRMELDAQLYIKDEAQNPTASFKSRGMSVAVTRARKLGAPSLVAPSAGNAGAALAAYGARAELSVMLFLPHDTPAVIVDECVSFGARVELVNGLIDEAGRRAAAHAAETGAFNLATLREPYRIEGKKTMGFELVEQLGAVPGTIVYPAGGGTGLIAMWKAFDELEACGWIGSERPMLICAQAAGCAPIVRAFETGAERAEPWVDGRTAAWGLRVPSALGDRLMLSAIRKSNGVAIAVPEQLMLDDMRTLRSVEGIDAGEEGGAALGALRIALAEGMDLAGPIVAFNTGSALTYGSRETLAPRRALNGASATVQ